MSPDSAATMVQAETPAISLRPAREEDRELLFRVYAGTREEELRPVGWSEAEKAAFLGQQFEAQDAWWRTHYHGASFDVVVVDGQDAGRLYLYESVSDLRIVDIALLPAWRGKGVGTAILEGLKERAAAGGRRLSIHVEKFNPALRLYERLGFRPIEDRGVYLFMEWSGDAAR